MARNWQYAPRLVLEGHSYVSEGYDIKQRAYVLSCKSAGEPSALELELQASEESPVVNPCFVVKGWGEIAAKVKIDGKPVKQGKASYEVYPSQVYSFLAVSAFARQAQSAAESPEPDGQGQIKSQLRCCVR